MPQEFLCPKCHQPVKPTAKFCGNCGQALQPAQEVPATPVPGTTPTQPTAGPTPAHTIPSAGTQPPPAAYAADTIGAIPGATAAAWFAIVLGSLFTLYSIAVLVIGPESLVEGTSADSVEALIVTIALVVNIVLSLPLVICGIILTRTKKRTTAKHLLGAIGGMEVFFAFLGLTTIIAAILPAIGAFLSFRAFKKA